MSENNENAPEMPEPQPVFDVTYAHIYSGQVYNQFYFFLWISLAFFIGAILPWNGEFGSEGFTIWQMIMMVSSVGAFWTCIASIKSRRLTLWPVLTLEILAVLFVLIQYRDVQATSSELRMQHQAAVQAEMDAMPNLKGEAGLKYRELLDAKATALAGDAIFPLTAGKVFGAPIHGMIMGKNTDLDDDELPTRYMATTAWNSFGSGFHMTWIAMASLTVFMLISFFSAFKNAKPKEDPKEARRRAREARASGGEDEDKDDKEIVGQQDETKV